MRAVCTANEQKGAEPVAQRPPRFEWQASYSAACWARSTAATLVR